MDGYRKRANEDFADQDIGTRLAQQFDRQHPEPREAYTAAFDAGKRIIGPHLRRGGVIPPPSHPSKTFAKVWVAMLISPTGTVEIVNCFGASGEPLHDANAEFIEKQVRALEFKPVTADGEAIPFAAVFPAWTDRHMWFAKASFAR